MALKRDKLKWQKEIRKNLAGVKGVSHEFESKKKLQLECDT